MTTTTGTAASGWTCACGASWAGLNFCGACGRARPPRVEVELLTAAELREVVETWEKFHRGQMDQDRQWAMLNLACDVAEAQRAKFGSRQPTAPSMREALPSVEELAKAIYENGTRKYLGSAALWDDIPESWREEARTEASAALALLASPPAQPTTPEP